ncbi:FtsK/SpoIIIE domain-containing protein, partial [Streptomyces sp. PSKA30]|uniref:FtsK/SpoIIIE domain-containing protein n=1 Tax=Streptomyces sp. PSKA30 TaxID=2874597 RepID=UPI0021E237EF
APQRDGAALRVAIGMDEEHLAPVWHDFGRTPHLMAVGDTESGKTNLLKLIVRAIVGHYTPQEARILTVDFRRSLADAVPEEYRLGAAVSAQVLQELVAGAADALRQRLPGADITPARMRLADWWQGPRLFVLVDDYEMVGSGAMGHPLAPFFEFLALGHEVGLNLVVVRSATGASRSLSDQLMRRLDEANAPGLLLSCPPTEGYLFGNFKPRNLPPGRGHYFVRRKPVLIQTALLEEEPES